MPAAPSSSGAAASRTLGFVFNPVSVYFCLDAADGLTAVIYRVNNSFGDRIAQMRRTRPTARAQPAGARP